MNPETRTFLRVTIENAESASKTFSELMGESVEPRREYITEFADFNKVDTFLEREEKNK